MAKKKQKSNLPSWVKSKFFILGVVLVLAIGGVAGYMTFASGSGAYISPDCLKTTISQTSNNKCVLQAKNALNWSCYTYPPLVQSNYFNFAMTQRVKGFQAETKVLNDPAKPNQLSIDGVIGPKTWAALYHYNRNTTHGYHSVNCYWNQ